MAPENVVWRQVQTHALYEVSQDGRVRNRETGTERKLWLEDTGYYTVSLRNPGEKGKRLKVHRLMAEAFIPNPEGLPFVRHLNDIRTDNRIENLAWGTNSDNQKDSIRNGSHWASSKTHCPAGHEYTPETSYIRRTTGSRVCSVCENERARLKRSKGLPLDDPRHGTPNGYRNWGCRCGSCREADRVYARLLRGRKRGVTCE